MGTFDILLYAAGLVRDFAALIFAGTGVLAFLIAMIKLSRGKPQKLDSQTVNSGLLALVCAVLGCFAPVEKGILFGRTESIVFLVLGTGLWVLVLMVRRRVKARP